MYFLVFFLARQFVVEKPNWQNSENQVEQSDRTRNDCKFLRVSHSNVITNYLMLKLIFTAMIPEIWLQVIMKPLEIDSPTG